MFYKKRKQIKKSEQKKSLLEKSSKKALISSFNNSDIKESPVSGLAIIKSEPKAKNICITIIGADIHCRTCCLKEALVFAVSMKDIQYEAEKEARAMNDAKSLVPLEYHDFFHVFSKIRLRYSSSILKV